MRLIVASLFGLLFATSVASAASISVGGFLFDGGETAFADDALLVSGSGVRFNCTAGGAAALSFGEALSGSDITQCANVSGGGDGVVEVLFTNNSIANGAGTDLVIFEVSGPKSPGTPDPRERFEVSIFDGSAYSPFVAFDPVATGFGTPEPTLDIFAVQIDLSSFGIAPGAQVDRVRLHLFDVGLGSKGADIAALGAVNSGVPVPEPSSILLLGIGLVALAAGCRTPNRSWSLIACLVLSVASATADGAIIYPGDLIVTVRGGIGGTGSVIRVDPQTGVQTVLATGGSLVDPIGIAIDPAGNLLVADQSAFGGLGGIIRIDPVTGAQATIASGGSFVAPTGITLDMMGSILVTDIGCCGAPGRVIRVDPVTGLQTIISSAGSLTTPGSITVDAVGDLIVVDADMLDLAGGVIRVNPLTGDQVIVSSDGKFDQPSDIAIDASGDIFVIDAASREVIRVDPLTGVQTIVSSSGFFSVPVGIAIDANGDFIVVDEAGGILRVDHTTGAQNMVSSGGSFSNPFGIAIVPIPEPTTISLLVIGLGVVGIWRRAWPQGNERSTTTTD